MPHTSIAYRTLVAAAVPLIPAVLRSPRNRDAHTARVAAPRTIAGWAATHRDPARPLAWFHAASVGEGHQAAAVISALRTVRPDLQFVFTHFSASAERFAQSLPVDLATYLPYDRRRDMSATLDALEPDLLVFAKLDLWPELATSAAARGARVALIAATVLPDSGRLRWPVRQLALPGYAAVSRAAAVSADDAARLITLGVRRDAIRITGEPRIDAVLEVVAAIDHGDPLTTLSDPAVTCVAGSTWPPDEGVLLSAFAKVRASHADARLIVVPHEPTFEHLAAFDAMVTQAGLPPAVRLSALGPGAAPALLVADRVGVLARLYANGGIAYVGGGWGTAGIHSVLEPAALARPVIIGPHDRGSRDAAMLHAAGALTRAPVTEASAWLAREWMALLGDGAGRAARGNAGRAALEDNRGAAVVTASLLASMLADAHDQRSQTG